MATLPLSASSAPPTDRRATRAVSHQDARIIESVARVQMSQTFVNESSQTVEVRCVIPVPAEAIVQNLTFMVNGKEIEGKLLPASEANRIYQSYVARMKDPALIQWIGSGLIQTNVFPIPPKEERTVTIGYNQVVSRTNGLLDWQIPLKAAGYSSQPLESVSIHVYLEDSEKLGNIYSPTHALKIARSGDRAATIKYRSEGDVPVSNFRLIADTSTREFAASFLGYRPVASEPGYFLLMLHPSISKEVDTTPKNVVLVLDKSGSMRGEKIEQARNALLYVLDHLPEKDRVGIVVYDGNVQTFRSELISAADKREMESARTFVRSMGASGSTNIDLGLESAMQLLKGVDGKSYIVHLSDGVPTVGETDERKIVANFNKLNKERHRIFNFGVGYDVNSRLLNRLSRDGFGQTFFVDPVQNIEEPVSALYDRLGQPALSDLRWEIVDRDGKDRGSVADVYPNVIPDLFSGDQTTVFGRYRGSGEATLVLTGKLGGKDFRFEQRVDLDNGNNRSDRKDIATFWASRRAAAIIDEIDLEGKKDKLIDELLELSKRYGIMTPYTAFLAEEPDQLNALAASRAALERRFEEMEAVTGGDAFTRRSLNKSLAEASSLGRSPTSRGLYGGDGAAPGGGGMAMGGRDSLGAAGGIRVAQGPSGASGAGQTIVESLSRAVLAVRHSGERAFFFREGKWVDSAIEDASTDSTRKIERFSEEYFQWLEKHIDQVREMLDVEEPILVKIAGEVFEI